MFVFKCKMCGGDLNVTANANISTCEYCGSTMTLPRLDDDRRAALYERANHFRRMNEYDKAAGIYETILNEDRTDSEAHWSLVLCKYGVEYVKDPASGMMIPTCNRTVYQSVFADEDYKQAIQNADDGARKIYEAEAEAIKEIQKGIIEISANVEPYDVFICYKESGNNNDRTIDSVLAQDIYEALVEKNLRVFFARITLEDKLGSQYEPYIFAALNTAKVMLVIGTTKEHMEAVWVKNEWTRFLALIKKDKSKVIIPCYKDMSAYDLPEELLVLQSQDMNKIGFLQDLIRGVKKIAGDSRDQVPQQKAPQQTNVDTMLQRAFNLINEYKRDEAEQLFNRVLEIDPSNARAYFGMALIDCYIYSTNPEKIAEKGITLARNADFERALELADESYRKELLKIKQGAVTFSTGELEERIRKGKKRKRIFGTASLVGVIMLTIGIFKAVNAINMERSGIETADFGIIMALSSIGGIFGFYGFICFVISGIRIRNRRKELNVLMKKYENI